MTADNRKSTGGAQAFSTQTESSTTFDDFNMRRASPVTCVLHSFGAVFADSCGNQDTYALSERVPHIDWFISHNWTTPRLQKFFCLALFFNLRFAASVTGIATMITFVLLSSGALPLYEYTGYNDEHGVYCTLVAPCTFLFAILFAHEIQRVCYPSSWRVYTFLDKTCISQDDLTLKMKGISKIAAFLRHSRGIAIVYTDLYFHRLWTVYEVASVLLVHPEATIGVIPSFAPFCTFCLTNVTLLAALITQIVSSKYIVDVVFGGLSDFLYFGIVIMIYSPAILAYTILLRWWGRQHAMVSDVLQKFNIRQAECSVESDRELVQANVIAFVRDLGGVNANSSPEDALDVFNAIVRKELPLIMSTVIFPSIAGIHYKYILVGVLPMIGHMADTAAVSIYSQTGFKHAMLCVADLLLPFTLFPNILAIVGWNARRGSHVHGILEKALICFLFLWSLFISIFLYLVWSVLAEWARDSMLYLLVYHFYQAAHVMLTVRFYHPNRPDYKRNVKSLRMTATDHSRSLSYIDDQLQSAETGTAARNDCPPNPDTLKDAEASTHSSLHLSFSEIEADQRGNSSQGGARDLSAEDEPQKWQLRNSHAMVGGMFSLDGKFSL